MRAPSLALALVAIAVSIAVAASIQAGLLIDGPVEPAWLLMAFPLLTILYAAAGLVAWWRRPSNRVGLLLLVGSWFYLLAGLVNTDITVFIAIGQITAILPFALTIHLAVVYPSGRAPNVAGRLLIAFGYFTATAVHLLAYLVGPSPDLASPLQIADRPDLQDAARWAVRLTGLAIVFAASVVVFGRLRGLSRPVRRVVIPVVGYGLITVVFIPVSAAVARVMSFDPITLFELQFAVLGLVPLAFAAGVLVGGFARTGDLVELGAWLGADRRRPELQSVLVDTLGDPSVELVFWLPDQAGYVDGDGLAVALPEGEGDANRRHELIELDGRRLGAIVYDASVIENADLVRTAGRVVSVAIDRQRLIVELLASREALRASRVRIVEEGDRERRRIARDLHDGLQARLVLTAIRAQQLSDDAAGETRATAAGLREDVECAIDELRRLVHGVLPPLLLERGLTAAATDFAERMPVPTQLDANGQIGRLPPAVESAAYFVVVESLTNVVKHSEASRVHVRIDRRDGNLAVEVRDDGVGVVREHGAGLSGLDDRLDALGGRLAIDFQPGVGTHVRAEVPCES